MKLCKCGCGQMLVEKPHHLRKPPRFLLGHNTRTRAFKRMKESLREKPPTDWIPPSGFCGCGCGQKTAIARQTRRDRDEWKGVPLRFIQGHHARLIRGAATSNWNGGSFVNAHGYRLILMPDHPNAYQTGYVPEHRLVWERANGRLLERHEVIHHINGKKADNRIENLDLMTGGEQSAMHKSGAAYRRRQSQLAKKRFADPAFKLKWLKSRKGIITPALRRKLSEATKRVWADPDKREKMLLAQKIARSKKFSIP